MEKYQKIFAFLIVFMFIGTSWFYYDNYVRCSGIVKVSEKKSIKSNSAISMMYETEAGSGEYAESEDTAWPTGNYKFNATLSKCENGSTISWDDINKNILLSATKSDKCYVYFDYDPPRISDYIKELYSTDGENSLYLHDADLANGANDESYRYAGASESVNNYVCFASDAEVCPDDNLYRIIGVFGDNVKLIKSDYATSTQLGTDGDYYGAYDFGSSTYKGANYANVALYYWDNTNGKNVWANSALNNVNLNTNYIAYLNGINTKWANMIAETTWKVGGAYEDVPERLINSVYQEEIVNTFESTTYTDEIGLMYVSDYGYAASPSYWTYKLEEYYNVVNSNWMHMGLHEWTITRYSELDYNAFIILDFGLVGGQDVSFGRGLAVRPVFYLKSSVGYSGKGDGTKQNPYRLVEPPVINFTADSNTYQAIEGMTWRQFVESEYNDGRFKNSVYIIYSPGAYLFDGTSYVKCTDIIIENKNYKGTTSGGATN